MAMWGLGKPVAALLALGILAMAGWLYATRWHPAMDRYPLQGIDLPPAPSAVEWGEVRASGADFAYLVATDGVHRDPGFETNWQAVPEAGLRRGAVHLFSLCAPPEAQADAFNTLVPRAEDALPPAVDLAYRDDCTDRPPRDRVLVAVRTLLARVETHTGKPAVLRISRGFDADYQVTAALDRPVWAMANFLHPRYAARPWRIWRASDVRRIQGLDGPVNWDVVAP